MSDSSEGGLPSKQQTQGDEPKVAQQKSALSPEQLEANRLRMLAQMDSWLGDDANVTNPNLQR